MRGAEGNGGPKERGPELVVVGHVGTSIVHAGAVSRTAAGGSGYAVAASAGTLIGDRTGLVAAVGQDFDLAPLRSRRVDLDGVTGSRLIAELEAIRNETGEYQPG